MSANLWATTLIAITGVIAALAAIPASRYRKILTLGCILLLGIAAVLLISLSIPEANQSPGRHPTSPSSSASNGANAPTHPSFQVPLAALCNAPGANVYICGTSYGGTAQTGDRLFAYTGENNSNADTKPPNYDLVLHFPNNTCTKLVVQFSLDDRTAQAGSAANIRLLQQKNGAVTATAVRGTIGTLTANLDGGPFDLDANATDGSQVFVNGYALCGTSSGE
ncbi:MAG: hypothetical protein ACRDRL_30075 [Sciscionella sp.]